MTIDTAGTCSQRLARQGERPRSANTVGFIETLFPINDLLPSKLIVARQTRSSSGLQSNQISLQSIVSCTKFVYIWTRKRIGPSGEAWVGGGPECRRRHFGLFHNTKLQKLRFQYSPNPRRETREATEHTPDAVLKEKPRVRSWPDTLDQQEEAMDVNNRRQLVDETRARLSVTPSDRHRTRTKTLAHAHMTVVSSVASKRPQFVQFAANVRCTHESLAGLRPLSGTIF